MVERLAKADEFKPQEDLVARALMHVAEMQRPFYTSLLNQMEAIERRLGEQGAIISDVEKDLAVILNQELLHQIRDHDQRLDALEKAETIRTGMALAAKIAPKALIALVIIVALVVAYLKIPNPISH